MGNVVVIQDRDRWLRFADPVEVIVAERVEEVLDAWRRVETAVSRHDYYAAGFVSYEAAAALNLATHPSNPDDPPLVWFGLYDEPQEIEPPAAAGDYRLGDWQPAIGRAGYCAAIERIKAYIVCGHTYQVNYTFPLRTDFRGDPWALFAALVAAQRANYMAFVDTGRHAICSASPELFFRLDGEELMSKPMKGTAVRGLTLAQDNANIEALRRSKKDRAENVMIVDMVRNDMGRVAHTGSVRVPHLFAVERYPTVLQMTSTVTGRTGAPLTEILRAMFPCASITGAPKVRTMEIIGELEPQPRGVYTGAIGMVAPGQRATFNVAIRTVVVDRQRGRAQYGVGSGIVWDSDPLAEYNECRLKAEVLTQRRPQFDLLESLLWEPDGGYFLLDRHLRRLADSAVYFGFDFDEMDVRKDLERLSETLVESVKVRVMVARNGRFTLESVPLTQNAPPQPAHVGLARTPVASDTVWLYHKTTQRQAYTNARASRPDCDEVILWNERGEITEASSSNVVVELDGALVTPPVACGLLAGTFRAELLAQGKIAEQVVTKTDVRRATAVYLINSVRRWQRCELN